jgi:hypothetical protein
MEELPPCMITRSPNQYAEVEAGLSVLMLRSVLRELLIGGDKLAGGERFASARVHDDVHDASSSTAEPTRPAKNRA